CAIWPSLKLRFQNQLPSSMPILCPVSGGPEMTGDTSAAYTNAKELGVGIGGPDLLPYKRSQMNHAYSLMRENHGAIPCAIAVQADDYEYENPQTHRRVTVAELMAFAAGYLRIDYLFWEAREPFYSREVLPALRSRN